MINEKDAIEKFNERSVRSNVATIFAPETIIYPVEVEYQPGVKTVETRFFILAGSYYSELEMEMGAQYKKQYPELNKEYTKRLEALGIPTKMKEYPLRATPIEVN